MSDPGSTGISSEDNDTVCQMKNGWILCTDDFVGGKMVRDIVYFSPAMVTQEHKIKEGQISVFPDFSFLFFFFKKNKVKSFHICDSRLILLLC